MTFVLLTFLASLATFAVGYRAGWRDGAAREVEISNALAVAAFEARHDQVDTER